MFQREEPFKGPNLIIDVPSVDEALKGVEAAGGTVVKERFAVGEMGFCGYFTDTEGNLLGVWENA
jgi:predicted enzyme related to lactoylglutathione lyase